MYPRKGAKVGKSVQGHFEDNFQRQRSCNNSCGIFFNYCTDTSLKNVRLLKRKKNTLSLTSTDRKTPEMYVYMDNYGSELIQALTQDIALFYYVYKNRDTIYSDENNETREDYFLCGLKKHLRNMSTGGYHGYKDCWVPLSSGNRSLNESRPAICDYVSKPVNKYTRETVETFNSSNISDEDVDRLSNMLKYTRRITGEHHVDRSIAMGMLGFIDHNCILTDNISNSDLNYFCPGNKTENQLGRIFAVVGKIDDFFKDIFIPKFFTKLFNNDVELQNLELFYSVERLGEELNDQLPKLIKKVGDSIQGKFNDIIDDYSNEGIIVKKDHRNLCDYMSVRRNKTTTSDLSLRINTKLQNIMKCNIIICQEEDKEKTQKTAVDKDKREWSHDTYKTFDVMNFDLNLNKWYEFIDVEETHETKQKLRIKFEFVNEDLNNKYMEFSQQKKQDFFLYFSDCLFSIIMNIWFESLTIKI